MSRKIHQQEACNFFLLYTICSLVRSWVIQWPLLSSIFYEKSLSSILRAHFYWALLSLISEPCLALWSTLSLVSSFEPQWDKTIFTEPFWALVSPGSPFWSLVNPIKLFKLLGLIFYSSMLQAYIYQWFLLSSLIHFSHFWKWI